MNMQEFLNKAGADQVLAEKMSKATSPDEAYAIAREAGLTDSYDTFVDTMKKLNEAAGEMNADEIDSITGGGHSVSEIVSTTVSGVVMGTLAALVSSTT